MVQVARIRREAPRQDLEIVQMIGLRVRFAEENGVVAPDDAIGAQRFGKTLKGGDERVLFGRDARLNLGSVGIERKLKVVHVVLQLAQAAQHGERIFGPEHQAVDYVGA